MFLLTTLPCNILVNSSPNSVEKYFESNVGDKSSFILSVGAMTQPLQE